MQRHNLRKSKSFASITSPNPQQFRQLAKRTKLDGNKSFSDS